MSNSLPFGRVCFWVENNPDFAYNTVGKLIKIVSQVIFISLVEWADFVRVYLTTKN